MHFLHEYTLGSHIEFLLTAMRVKLVNPLCTDGRIDLLVYLAIFQLFGTFPIPCEFSNIFIKGFSIFYSASFSLGCNSRWPDALAAVNNSNCLTIYLPSPGNLLNPGIEPRSPTLQADSLWSEPPEKPQSLDTLYYRML